MHSLTCFVWRNSSQQLNTVMYLNQVYQSLLEVGFAACGFSRISYSHSGGRGLGRCRRNHGWRRLVEWLLKGAGREKHRIVWPRNSETWSLRDSLELNKRKMTMLDWNLLLFKVYFMLPHLCILRRPCPEQGSCDWFGKPSLTLAVSFLTFIILA